MGLDMYLYKISKPKLDKKKVYQPDEIDASYVKLDELENNQIPYSMMKYCEEILVDHSYPNYKEIFEEFKNKYPDKYDKYTEYWQPILCAEYSDNNKTIRTFKDRDLKIKLFITHEDDYTIKKVDKCLAWKSKEIAYHRGWLEDGPPLPENCHYCHNEDLIHELVEDYGLSKDFIDNWSDDTFFFAWW